MMRKLLIQTAFLSCTHFLVRMLGFVMRIWLSHELGPQGMAIAELAQSAQMLLVTPVVTGLPAAISRMSAQASAGKRTQILRCGILLALMTGMPLAVCAYLLRTPLSLWLGDIRTLPALVIYLPCVPILGISCALNGYCYGTDHPAPPAACELIEQAVRFMLCLWLVQMLKDWPLMLKSAAPAAAAVAGEAVSLAAMIFLMRKAFTPHGSMRGTRILMRRMISLAAPLTGIRVVTSLMRTVQSVLIPARLQVSGLPAAEALARYGMLSGMVMPILMMPSFITCSLSMIAAPELSRRQQAGKPGKRLIRRILLLTLGIGLCAAAGVYMLAPVLSQKIYRQPELLPLLKGSSPLIPLLAMSQVVSGMMNGLGLQGKTLRYSLAANLLSLLAMYALTAQAEIRIWGPVIATALSHTLTLLLSLHVLLRTD